MTIDEAIIHCEEMAIRNFKNENNAKCVQCGEEHVQLAKWLKELKDYKSREYVVEVVRCGKCIHNNDCEIQYSAQAGENFFCGCGERKKQEI